MKERYWYWKSEIVLHFMIRITALSFFFLFASSRAQAHPLIEKCKGEKICMSSMEEKNSKNYTEALDWVGPKEKILPGLKSILDKLKLEKTLEKEDSIQVFMKSGLNSNIKFQFHFNDQDKKIDLKAFSNDSSVNKDEITKRLEEIKFKYFQREF